MLGECVQTHRAHAASIEWEWTVPMYQAVENPDSMCGYAVGADSLANVEECALVVWRFTHGDTLLFLMPCSRGDSMKVETVLTSGSYYQGWAMAKSSAGWSCEGNKVMIAIPPEDFEPGLHTVLFDTADMTGPSTVLFNVPNIAFDWDYGSPHPSIQPDTFSGTMIGYLSPAITGEYVLIARAEDGDSLMVNGSTVIRDWAVQEEHERSVTISLAAGVRYPFRLDFFHNNGDAMLRLDWIPPGGTRQVIPAEAFSQ